MGRTYRSDKDGNVKQKRKESRNKRNTRKGRNNNES